MAKNVPIAVIWDSRRGKLTVAPDFVTVYSDLGDTAEWTLLTDEDGVEIAGIDFKPPNGPPFNKFENPGGDKRKIKGVQIKGGPGQFHKYTVRLSNGETLDPGIRRQPNP